MSLSTHEHFFSVKISLLKVEWNLWKAISKTNSMKSFERKASLQSLWHKSFILFYFRGIHQSRGSLKHQVAVTGVFSILVFLSRISQRQWIKGYREEGKHSIISTSSFCSKPFPAYVEQARGLGGMITLSLWCLYLQRKQRKIVIWRKINRSASWLKELKNRSKFYSAESKVSTTLAFN